MATTYKDFYIYYNGTYYDGSVDNGLTAVNCYYNGTYFGEGARTIPTAGYYCDYNFTIGNKSISSAGYYCDYNYQVTTQNRYKWYRYYATKVYSQVTQDYNAFIDLEVWKGNFGTMWTDGNGISFSSSTGMYTISGGRSRGFTNWSNSSDAYYGKPGYGNVAPEAFHFVDGSFVQGINISGIDYVYAYHSTSRNLVGTKYETTYSYTPGSYIDVVQSTNSGAYPSNGTWDGTYWYVAI